MIFLKTRYVRRSETVFGRDSFGDIRGHKNEQKRYVDVSFILFGGFETSDYFKADFWTTVIVENPEPRREYKIIDVLGIGGSATTHLATCLSPLSQAGTLVAMKFFRKYSRPERISKFIEEAEFLTSCKHPCIAPVIGLQLYYDRPLIVAEYMPRTLRTVINDNKTSLVDKASYSLQLLSGLVYLEEQGVIHRDIKPENIYIKGKSCMLGDFGMMKQVAEKVDNDDDLVASGVGVSRYYWSPDQIEYMKGDAEISSKSDVFQLGLVLAHLFTGRNPMKVLPTDNSGNPDLDAAEEAARNCEQIGWISSELGQIIHALITRMLTYDPDERPQANELINEWIDVFREVAYSSLILNGTVFER